MKVRRQVLNDEGEMNLKRRGKELVMTRKTVVIDRRITDESKRMRRK